MSNEKKDNGESCFMIIRTTRKIRRSFKEWAYGKGHTVTEAVNAFLETAPKKKGGINLKIKHHQPTIKLSVKR